MKHVDTLEPWYVSLTPNLIIKRGMLGIVEKIAVTEGPDYAEHARRIVACVNACAGIDTQVLLDDPGFIRDALYRLQSLEE